MKKLLIIPLLLLLISCENKPFTGYVIGKEYIQGHMCCSDGYKHIVQASPIIVPHPVPIKHHHSFEKSKFIISVANKYRGVCDFNVDSIRYKNYKLGQRITIK